MGRVLAVIPKRKSIVPRVRDVLQHKYQLLDISRFELMTEDSVLRHIAPLQRNNPLCLLDIGGYFAPLASMDTQKLGLQVSGIVEDTENGHIKYEQAIQSGECRHTIYSVARSELKRPENFLVGQCLVFSVEAILRKRDELLHGRRACVIGYGNIGRSIAQHLHERHVNVTVFDIDPIKLIEAFTHGFQTPSTLQEALADADVVFCVTGSRSIGAADLHYLRPHTYVATVTSPDDEFRLDEMELDISHRDGHISEVRLADGKVFYLMNRGQAVNFLHGSVVGPFIQLLQAEILATCAELLSRPLRGNIGFISGELKRKIAMEWLGAYRH
jgi:adenosylhomocysteinase